MKRALKWAGGVFGVYAVFVLLFEAVYLGHFQPSFAARGIPMIDLTTTDGSGKARTRRLARFESQGSVYVSAHHWPRGWHHALVARPEVSAEIDGVAANYVAVPVTGAEFQRVAAEYPIPFFVRFLMGFPPERDIVRLDPVAP